MVIFRHRFLGSDCINFKAFAFLAPGGGGVLPYYVCILRMFRAARDPHFQPRISVPEHIIFTNYQKIRLGASPFHICGRILPFRRPSFSFFFFNPFIASHARPAQPALRSAAPRDSGRSLDSHFHAQNGSRSFRSPAFSRSKRLKLVPEPRIFKLKTAQARSGAPHFYARPGARSRALAHFSLCRGTYVPKFGVSTPPPPGGGGVLFKHLIVQRKHCIRTNFRCAYSFISTLFASCHVSLIR